MISRSTVTIAKYLNYSQTSTKDWNPELQPSFGRCYTLPGPNAEVLKGVPAQESQTRGRLVSPSKGGQKFF